MAQADQTVQNASFPAVRTDINNNLAALFSNSSGNTAPTVTVAHMDWIDTSGADPIWKKRNAANNGWITIGTIKTSTLEFSGTNVLPSQTGNSGKYLTTDGTVASWGIVPPGSTKEVFTASGTWTKPSTGNVAYVEIWSGGGGGGRGSSTPLGGGGGAYRWAFIALSDLSATVTVTVGSGGAGAAVAGAGSDGGNTSFGSYVSAFGGGGGGSSTSTGEGGYWASDGYVDLPGVAKDMGDGTTLWVGGQGGSSTSNGSSSVHGGGGGGGTSTTVARAGGTSIFGGNGGSGGTGAGVAGSAPGGGGGGGITSGGNGARGEVRVYVW